MCRQFKKQLEVGKRTLACVCLCASTASAAFTVATLMSDPLWLFLCITLFIQFVCVCVFARALFIRTDRVLLCVCVVPPLTIWRWRHLLLCLLLLPSFHHFFTPPASISHLSPRPSGFQMALSACIVGLHTSIICVPLTLPDRDGRGSHLWLAESCQKLLQITR